MRKVYLFLLLSCLGFAGYAQSYCSPSFYDAAYSCTYGYSITSFGVTGESSTSISDGSSCDGSGYLNQTGLSPVTFEQSYSYSANIGSSNSMNCQVWIDFNDDSTFQTTESVGGTNYYYYSGSFNIDIPRTADTGIHRMRVMATYAYFGYLYPNLDPCGPSYYYYGEIRDYLAHIIPLPLCSGTPTAGTASSDIVTACPSLSFALNLTGYSSFSGLTFQWQSSTDSITWANISGDTTASSSSTETAASYYRCLVTCSASSITDSSTAVQVLYSPVCYCSPGFTGAVSSCSYGYTISSFDVTGESSTAINDAASCNSTGYLDRTSLSVTFEQSYTYSANLSCGNYSDAQIWIDFDNDGTFASSESVGGSNYFYSTTINMTMPITAPTGHHRMRVLVTYAYSGYSFPTLDPCASSYYYGEARDYDVNIIPLPGCTAAPAAGNATADIGTACPAQNITLTVSGFSVAGGLGFQWQTSPDSTTWTDVAGATSTTYVTTETALTYYRCKVTCVSLSLSNLSTMATVNYFGHCYCTPYYYYASYSCSSGYYSITSYSVTGESSTSINDVAACSGTGYSDRTSLSVNFMDGTTYSANIVNGYSSMTTQTWIDFSDDGVFDASESVGGVNSYYYSTTYNIVIPILAPTGMHRMRVVTSYAYIGSTYPSIDPCVASGYYYGDTRDYMVNIVPLPACTGTPTAGTASASIGTACPAENIPLNLAGYTVSGSLTFQWQSSPDSTTWTNISGATTVPYNATETSASYFRCVVTCTASGASDSSNGVQVNYSPVCYCMPSFYYTTSSCTYGYSFTSFYVNGESGTAIADAAACNSTGYMDQTRLTVTFEQSYSYTATFGVGTTVDIQAWIDYNDDGTFATSETLGGVNYVYYSATVSFTIPILATPGNHRMRILATYPYSGYAYPTLDPCAPSSYYYGEVRDYTVHIIPLPACTGAPTAGTASSSFATACPSLNFDLNLTGFTVASALAFQWQSSADSITWSDISGATTVPYTTSASAITYFRCRVICTASSDTAYSNNLLENYSSVCYCTPSFIRAALACSNYSFAINEVYTVGESGSSFDDTNPCTGFGYQDRTGLSVTYMQANTYSATVTSDVGTSTTSYSLDNQFWIDFNDDGTFDASESIGGLNSYSGLPAIGVTSLSIPITATVGTHRMRVVQVYPSSSSVFYPNISSCPSGYPYYYGEARDYTVNIIALPPCTGRPTAGVPSGPGIACPSSAINLGLVGSTISASLTYDWQSSPDSTTWSDISGGTTEFYTTSESSATYYRCIVTCTSTSLSDTSSFIYVLYHSACPCAPSYYYYTYYGSTYPAFRYAMNNFLLNGYSGSTINDAGPTIPDASGYEDQTAIAINLQQGGSYSGTVHYDYNTYGYENMVWIDFDDDGNFATSEEVTGVFGPGGYTYVTSTAFTMNIPITANPGTHLMRVRNAKTYVSSLDADMDPCNYYYSGSSFTYYYYGMTRDYTAKIIPLPPCSGRPTAGTVNASIGTACPSETFTLSQTGYTVAGSLAFQWQSSPDSTTWSDISGATSTSFSTTASAVTFYRSVVTCTASSLQDTSNVVKINYISVCYCFPTFYYLSSSCATYPFSIGTFTVAGASSTYLNDIAPCAGTGYQDRTALSVTFMQGVTYTANLLTNTGSTSSTTNPLTNQVWIDFNDDGNFDASESVGGVSNFTGNPASTSISLAIPLGVPTGNHRMRIVEMYTDYAVSYPSISPCPTGYYPYYYGEARDYTVNIIPVPPCSGTPTGGAAVASSYTACASSTFTLGLSGSTLATGLTYQWQSTSDTTTAWSNIAGATLDTFSLSESSSMYYRCYVTCTTSSASAYSSFVFVNYLSACYCTPSYYDAYYSCAYFSLGVTQFTLNGLSGLSINDNIPCDGVTGYEDHSGMVAGLAMGSTYVVTIGFASYTYTDVQTWIDFNDDGTFAASESLAGYTSRYASSDTFNLTIPSSGVALGYHKMRMVYINNNWSSLGYSFPSLDPCTPSYDYGEARDYTIRVLPPACTSTPAVATISADTTYSCSPFTSTITASGYTTGEGLVYQWQSSSDSTTWTNITGATDSTYAVAISGSGAYYRFVDSCSAAGLASYSAGVRLQVFTTPVVLAIGGADSVCNGATTTLTDATTGGTWSVSNTNASVSTSGVVTGAAAGYDTIVYTVTNVCASNHVSYAMRVKPLANAGYIIGASSVCIGSSTSFTESVTGGVWSSSNTAVATINTSASVSTVDTGVTIISYAVTNSCGTVAATNTLTVVAPPSAGSISGTFTVCEGSSTTLTGTISGGTWLSTNTSLATITAGGVLHGVAAGRDSIIYAVTNACRSAYDTQAVTIAPLPHAGVISGTSTICTGISDLLSETATTGNWIATNTNASITSGGTVTGAAAGRDTILYVVANSCGADTASHPILISPAPFAGVIGGLTDVCIGSNIVLSETVSGGAWVLANSNASMHSDTLTGNVAGVDTVYYLITNSCGTDTAMRIITIHPLASAGTIVGAGDICQFVTFALTDTVTGGTWHVTNTNASVSTGGSLTGRRPGLDTLTYTVTNFCGTAVDSVIFTVNPAPQPSPISGVRVVCEAASITLYASDTTGSWSVTNGHAFAAGSVITGVSAGRDTVVYTITNICGDTSTTFPITVNPLPQAGTITDSVSAICVGGYTTFLDTVSGGVWSSSDTSIATVRPFGLVHGVSGGSVIISLTVTNSCGTASAIMPFTINPVPHAGTIYGDTAVCVAATTIFHDTLGAPSAGLWSTSNPTIASVDPYSGTIYGGSPGTAYITYTVNTATCGSANTTRAIIVKPLPYAGTITGPSSVCAGSTITLTDVGGTGGSWSSSTGSVATIDATGHVRGVSAGNTTITFTSTSSFCGSTYVTVPVTVNALPVAGSITGLTSVCVGASITLSDASGTSGGVWSSSDTSRAIVSRSTGIVTGVSSGGLLITYTAVTASCGSAYTTQSVTVNPLPVSGTISGSPIVCVGVTTSLTESVTGGVWHVSNSHATISGGAIRGISVGLDTVTYAVTNVCGTSIANFPVTVSGLPTAGLISGPSTVCLGATVTLSDTVSGGSWSTSNGHVVVFGGAVTGISVGRVVVYYDITTGCGTATATDSITVLPNLTPGISVTAYPSTSVCTGDYVLYSAVPVNGGTAPSYTWYLNGHYAGTGASFSNLPSNGDVISCDMVSNAPCAIGGTVHSPSVVMTVHDPVTPTVTITSSRDSVAYIGQVVTFTATVANGGSAPTYQWYVNSVAQPGATSTTFNLAVTHSECVTCGITSNAPCAEPVATSSNQICIYADNTGVQNVNAGMYSLSLYPNPNTGTFTLQGFVNSGAGNRVKFEVIDMTGKVVYSDNTVIVNGMIDYQVSLEDHVAPGQYIMKVYMENGIENIHFSIMK